ncbi:hypothetical protein PALA31_04731 [Pseudomonas aeruginosa]|nr:hypothetical protein Q051_01424 [Pseudomonas aeruginosa BWHPSA046]MDA1398467.1 hypothetical protein [Pseudomonas aeruginosa]
MMRVLIPIGIVVLFGWAIIAVAPLLLSFVSWKWGCHL